jgi:hypothetical protein
MSRIRRLAAVVVLAVAWGLGFALLDKDADFDGDL